MADASADEPDGSGAKGGDFHATPDFGDAVLSLFGTVTVFGTPVDITLSELTLEMFFPADTATADALRLAHEARMAGLSQG